VPLEVLRDVFRLIEKESPMCWSLVLFRPLPNRGGIDGFRLDGERRPSSSRDDGLLDRSSRRRLPLDGHLCLRSLSREEDFRSPDRCRGDRLRRSCLASAMVV
jgi:hypothetical protein